MERISTVVILIFAFCVKNIVECSTDTFVIAGWDVSLYWTLGNLDITSLKVDIRNSTGNKIAELSDNQCISFDNSFYCNTSKSYDKWILSLEIYNVSAGQSGNYGIQTYEGMKPTNISYVNLVVIGKPKVKEVMKPMLNQSFQITCDTHLGFEGLLYTWIINDTDITPLSNVNVYNISSVGMDDNFNHVTCRVCLNETASNVSRVIWKHDNCSTDSDTYTIQVIYGPTNISLNLSENNFYLKDDEFFSIDCFANCKPNCTFRWKGQDTINSNKLIFPNFEPRMAGQYTCYVTNQETNTTSKSKAIILYHVKNNNVKEDDMEVIGMGLVGVAVLLMAIGLTLIVLWCKNTSNKTVVNLQTPTNGEMSQVISRIQNRPLPDPNTQETASRRPTRPKYPNLERKSRSLHNLLDSAQDSFYPLRGGLSLQALHPSPKINDRSHKNGKTVHTTIQERRFSNCKEDPLGDVSLPENVKQDVLYAKVKKDRKTSSDEHNNGAKFGSLNNIQHENFKDESQEDLYSTIYETALFVYDDAKDNSTNENSNEEPRNTSHEETDYDYADFLAL